jgi:phosphoribosylformylglycinamidine cyclo-ligase
MGTRLELYTDQQTAEAIISFAKTLDVDAQIVGRVEASEQKEVIIRSQFGEFQYK